LFLSKQNNRRQVTFNVMQPCLRAPTVHVKQDLSRETRWTECRFTGRLSSDVTLFLSYSFSGWLAGWRLMAFSGYIMPCSISAVVLWHLT